MGREGRLCWPVISHHGALQLVDGSHEAAAFVQVDLTLRQHACVQLGAQHDLTGLHGSHPSSLLPPVFLAQGGRDRLVEDRSTTRQASLGLAESILDAQTLHGLEIAARLHLVLITVRRLSLRNEQLSVDRRAHLVSLANLSWLGRRLRIISSVHLDLASKVGCAAAVGMSQGRLTDRVVLDEGGAHIEVFQLLSHSGSLLAESIALFSWRVQY